MTVRAPRHSIEGNMQQKDETEWEGGGVKKSKTKQVGRRWRKNRLGLRGETRQTMVNGQDGFQVSQRDRGGCEISHSEVPVPRPLMGEC